MSVFFVVAAALASCARFGDEPVECCADVGRAMPASERDTSSSRALSSLHDPGANPAGDSYRVANGVLYDGCGEQVVLRGVNHPTMYVDLPGKAMAEIARTGANAVRLFWFAGHDMRIGQLEQAIDAAVAHGLLPMLELHDSTCSWELDLILDYWTSREARALIERHRKHLLINVANEPSPPDGLRFAEGYRDAILRLRDAGIHVPLVIDGARCGRDYQVLLDHGPALLAADPDHNLIFSAHLYDPLPQSALSDLFDRTRELELPFIVGELANREPPGCGALLDYAGILVEAERTQVGWLAWSWGDEIPWQPWNSDCAEFDMTSTFSFDTLQGWGKEVAVTHPASIQHTSVRPYALTHGDRCD